MNFLVRKLAAQASPAHTSFNLHDALVVPDEALRLPVTPVPLGEAGDGTNGTRSRSLIETIPAMSTPGSEGRASLQPRKARMPHLAQPSPLRVPAKVEGLACTIPSSISCYLISQLRFLENLAYEVAEILTERFPAIAREPARRFDGCIRGASPAGARGAAPPTPRAPGKSTHRGRP
jgi:hypothetical protein